MTYAPPANIGRLRRRGGPLQVADRQDAADLAAWHMGFLGFRDVARTEPGAGRGLDVTADRAVARVKYIREPVRRSDVQQLKGAAYGVEASLFYTLSGYTVRSEAVRADG